MQPNLEADFLPVTDAASVATRFLDGSAIEIVGELPRRARPQHVLFDFDGTLSLVREGWPEVMIPMMVKILQDTGTSETAEELHAITETFVMELNGKQTIYQMIRLAEEVARRGVSRRSLWRTRRNITAAYWSVSRVGARLCVEAQIQMNCWCPAQSIFFKP